MKFINGKTMPDEKKQALQFAMKLIGLRRRSVFEITKRLEQKRFNKDILGEVLKELERYKYIDDEKFAESYINDRMNFRPCGKLMVKKELEEKGIAENIINDKISELISEEKELKSARILVRKKLKTIGRNVDKRKIYQKIASYLQSKGYSFDTISQAIENEVEFQ